MYLLTNKDKREIALPAPVLAAVIIPAGDSVEISDKHYREVIKSRYATDQIASGTVVVKRTKNKKEPKAVARGVRMEKQEGGLWKVYVNGHLVTDVALPKKEAKRIAEQYA